MTAPCRPRLARRTRLTRGARPTRRARRGALLLAMAVLPACGAEPDAGPRVRATLDVAELLGGTDTLHARATDVRPFAFPADHGQHPEFRTEWWYFTGNLTAADGREIGYQLTFFRNALTDSLAFVAALAGRDDTDDAADADAVAVADVANDAGDNGRTGSAPADGTSAWRSRHAWLAHFAVSDIGSSRIHAAERFARGAAGLAGADAAPFRVWLDGWHAASVARAARPAGAAAADTTDAGTFPVRLVAAAGDVAIDLLVQQGKPGVLQGDRGLSAKGPEPGNASYYYSFTRMPTAGTVRIGDVVHRVEGTSWLDREWSTSVLSPGVTGWDWMALQLDDDTELMLYRLRRADGSAAPFSAGTFVRRDGSSQPLDDAAFTLTPVGYWASPIDGTRYPTSWRVEAPALDLRLDVRAAFDAQELDLSVRYWEGAVRVNGTRAGRTVSGRGYLEMTGWATERRDVR